MIYLSNYEKVLQIKFCMHVWFQCQSFSPSNLSSLSHRYHLQLSLIAIAERGPGAVYSLSFPQLLIHKHGPGFFLRLPFASEFTLCCIESLYKSITFPIPNIRQLFARMGTKKPTIFGVMDLTQDYHQAPLTFAIHAFTAFVTFWGVYQCTRLPFGLK